MAPAFAIATPEGEVIRTFNVNARIEQSSIVRVEESIVYDFGSLNRHGIFRYIPVSYTTERGNKQSAKITDITVVDERGSPYMFSLSRQGKNIEIKIGDPNVLITGVHTYVITYVVHNAIGYFEDFDELYWNATGNGWDAPIENAEVSVSIPRTAAKSDIKVSCYQGFVGNTERCTSSVRGIGENIDGAYFVSSRFLNSKEGLTIALGFPKGIVKEPTLQEQVVALSLDNLIILLPIVVLVFMIVHWRRHGRDPEGRGTIVPEYDVPDNLTPLEISALLHQGMRATDISAEIIYLATKGYIKIKKLEEQKLFFTSSDYTFEKTKDFMGLKPEYDEQLLKGFFASDVSKLSELKKTFYTTVPGIKKSVMEAVIARGYYMHNPTTTIATYVGVACIFFVVIAILAMLEILGLVSAISLFISGVIVIIFSGLMPKVTTIGAEVRERIMGFKMYLSVAEKDRIAFHNAPVKNPELFEKLLPFAMVLEVDKQWAKQFEGLTMQSPSWYSSPAGIMFNPVVFDNDISSFSDVAGSLSTAPGSHSGSGGGGFSGGGGGGGGGGSW